MSWFCQCVNFPYSFNFKPVPLTELMWNSRHTHTEASKRIVFERILYFYLSC